MTILRWVLGALVLAYGALCALMAGLNVAHKLGKLTTVPADAQRMIPLWDATPWWQLAIWGAATVLLLMAGVRLFTRAKAFGPLLLAVMASVASWWFMHNLPAYQTVFTEAEKQYDYYTFAVMGVVLVLTWITDRRK